MFVSHLCWNNKQSQNISVLKYIISHFSHSKTQRSRSFLGHGLLIAHVREMGRNTHCLLEPLFRTGPSTCIKLSGKSQHPPGQRAHCFQRHCEGLAV